MTTLDKKRTVRRMQQNAEAQRRFKARMRSDGYVQVALWIHKQDKKKLIDFCNELTAERLQT